MSLATIGGSMLSRLYSVASAAPAIEQNQVNAGYKHSLYNDSTYGNSAIWMHRMCVADGSKSWADRMTFGFDWAAQADPPTFPTTFSEVTFPGVEFMSNGWTDVANANINGLIVMADNYTGPPIDVGGNTDATVGGTVPDPNSRLWPAEMNLMLKPWIDNIGGTNVWLYETWQNGNAFFNNGDGSERSAGDFAAWRNVQKTTSNLWYTSLLNALKADTELSAHTFTLIPVNTVLMSVMENTAANVMNSQDWFRDMAPHGHPSTYLIAAAVMYTTIFQEQAPEPSFTGATIHSSITSNWTAIASHIATQVGI